MGTSCDVLVIGAGVAGAPAAVAAARHGARTILVEREHYVGGTGYAGMFQYICGLYLNAQDAPTETLNAGIVREIVDLLQEASPAKKIKKIGQVYVLPYTSDALQSVLTALCYREQNVATLRGHNAVAVTRENGKLKDVTVKGMRGTQVITPKTVIDCSGAGSIAALAGAECELASREERQLAGYVVCVKGLSNVSESLSLEVPYQLAQAVRQGTLSPQFRITNFSPGDAPDEGYLKMSIDAEEGAERDEQARHDAAAVHAYLATVLSEFQGSFIARASRSVLEREGRRIVGEYMLTKEDILSARKFPDGIVKNSWPIELWDRTKGTTYRYVPRGDYYEIPFRCLRAANITNLLTAGRCISVTHEALGSTRVMGTCMALGEQAGKAAAHLVKHGTYPEGKF